MLVEEPATRALICGWTAQNPT